MTLTKALLSASTAALILAGCTMAPSYDRPASPVAEQWPAGAAYAPQAQADSYAGQIQWQSFFRTPEMQDLIKTALENNRDLRIAALQVEQARAAYRIDRAALMPTINVTDTMNRQGIPAEASATGRDMVTSSYSLNAGTTAYELDFFGRIRSMNEKALQQYLATAEAQKSAQIALVAETANAYLAYLADRKLLTLSESTLKSQQDAFNLVKRRVDMGIAAQLELEQARTAVETARADTARYQRFVAQDRNALELLLGTPVDAVTLDKLTLDNIELLNELPVGLPSEVLLARPDIRAAEHNLLAANAQIGAARAAFFPSISLTGAAGLASTSLSALFSSGASLAWSFIPQITLPIFTGGRNVANLDSATAGQKIAVAQYEKAIQSAFREVADQLAARGTLNAQYSAQSALADAAGNAYRISRARYDQGTDNYLTVLDSQRALYTAQQAQIATQREQLANLVNLYKVLGGGAE